MEQTLLTATEGEMAFLDGKRIQKKSKRGKEEEESISERADEGEEKEERGRMRILAPLFSPLH